MTHPLADLFDLDAERDLHRCPECGATHSGWTWRCVHIQVSYPPSDDDYTRVVVPVPIGALEK